MGRKLRFTLDLIKPNIVDRVCQNQQKQKAEHDQGTTERNFEIGAPVFVKNFASSPMWLSGSVTKTEGYCSKLSDGRIVCGHGDHMLKWTITVNPRATVTDDDDPLMDLELPSVPELSNASNLPSPSPAVLRHSTRNHRPLNRFAC